MMMPQFNSLNKFICCQNDQWCVESGQTRAPPKTRWFLLSSPDYTCPSRSVQTATRPSVSISFPYYDTLGVAQKYFGSSKLLDLGRRLNQLRWRWDHLKRRKGSPQREWTRKGWTSQNTCLYFYEDTQLLED